MVSCASEQAEQGQYDLIAKLEEDMAQGARTLDPLAKLMNMEILWANAKEAEGVMHITPTLMNPYGMVHGGCLVTLADSVAGHNMAAAGRLCVTLSSTVNFLNPAKGKLVRCHSRVQKLGRRIGVVGVEARDENDALLLTALFTFSAMKTIPPHIITAPEEQEGK